MSDPRQAEANGSTATFTYRDVEFSVPLHYVDYSLSFIEAMGDGKSAAIQVRELLGPKQWARFRAMEPSGRDVEALVDAAQTAMGVETGELPPSSD